MRNIRNSHLFIMILVAASVTGTPVALAQTGVGPADTGNGLAAELVNALSKVQNAAGKLASLEVTIKDHRADVKQFDDELRMGVDPKAVNRKVSELSVRVNRTEKRLGQVAGTLDVLHDTLQKIQAQAWAKRLNFIARKAAQGIARVESLQERAKVAQSEIDAIQKDIQRLTDKTGTSG